MCQKTYQFLKHTSNEMLREISILYYYIKILHFTWYNGYIYHMYMLRTVSGKLPPRKLSPRKLPPRKLLPRKLPPMKIPPYEYPPLWKLPPVKINPQKFAPEKIAHCENYPKWNPLLTYKLYKWKKKQNYNFFCLEEGCAIQHPYQNNQGPLWYTNDLTENTGLRYFLYRMKKIQKSNESANRQVAFTCQLYKSRRTETRQSNYKIWQIGETTK